MKVKHHKIREVRLNKGYSQEFMAEVMEISQSQYSRLENGETTFDVEKLGKVIEILQVNPMDIIDFEESKTTIVNSPNANNNHWVVNSKINENQEELINQLKEVFQIFIQLIKKELKN